jgi:hypothetical protein
VSASTQRHEIKLCFLILVVTETQIWVNQKKCLYWSFSEACCTNIISNTLELPCT